MRKQAIFERSAQTVFLLCASVSVLAVGVIAIFIFAMGTPAIAKIGVAEFIFGMEWQPTADIYGIFPMIVSSVLLAALCVLAGAVVGIFTGVFMTEFAPKWALGALRCGIDLLAGIPSVVFGLFGITVVIPFVRNAFGGPGNSLLAAAIVVAVMVLPTIIATVQDAILSVPKTYREGAYALGSSKMQMIFRTVLPAAKSGIFAGLVLGVGRAIGETMAVIMVAGNRSMIPKSLLDPARTLTANIALEMGYASGLHQDALFATGIVLFIFIMLINGAIRAISRRNRV